MKVFIALVLLSLAQLLNADCHGGKKDEKCCPNFARLWPAKDFDEERFVGLWYSARWYIPDGFTWDANTWDYSHNFFTKEDAPGTMFFNMNYRLKDTMFCQDQTQVNMTRIFPGKYLYEVQDVTSTIIWTDYDNLALAFGCWTPGKDGCGDIEVVFWSRTKKLSKEHMMKGIEVMNKICYPRMSDFIDDKHQLDCTPSQKKSCDGKKEKSKDM